MQSFKSVVLSAPHGSLIFLASALGIAAAGFRAFESEGSKKKRTELKRQKELQSLAQKISVYGQTIHKNFRLETLWSASMTWRSNCESARRKWSLH